MDAVGVVDIGIVERDAGDVGRARAGCDQDRARRQRALRPIRQGDEHRAVWAEPGGALEVLNAPRRDLLGRDPLQKAAHLGCPLGDDRQRDIQRHRRPHAVDLLLAETRQVERSFAQGLRRRAAGGGHDAARVVLLDNQRPASEGGG